MRPLTSSADSQAALRAGARQGLGCALAMLFVAACSAADDSAVDHPTSCEGVELVAAASDYTSSLVCGAPRCERGPRTTGVDLGRDPQLSSSGGRTFYLARDRALLFELDGCGVPITRHDVSAGLTPGRANPHDVAAAPDGTTFVVLYGAARVLVLDREGAQIDEIDLSKYDEVDGNPQAESVRVVSVDGAPKAFVALERLDDAPAPPLPALASTRPSQMLRIGVASRTVEAVIELAGRNPFNSMAELGPHLFLAEPGSFDVAGEAHAGIERFDTARSTTELFITETSLGGSVSEIAVTEGCGAALVAGPVPDVNPTSLVTFDPTTGELFGTASAPLLGPTPGYDLQGLAWRGDRLYVGDRRAGAHGYPVHVFERAPGGRCDLRPAGVAFDLPERPVALRPAHGAPTRDAER